MIAVEGAIQTSNFTDKQGQNRKQIEVVANQVSFCGSKDGSQPTTWDARNNIDVNADDDIEEIVDDDDDLPF